MDTPTEIRRLEGRCRDLEALISELSQRSDASSQRELARQKELLAGLRREIAHLKGQLR